VRPLVAGWSPVAGERNLALWLIGVVPGAADVVRIAQATLAVGAPIVAVDSTLLIVMLRTRSIFSDRIYPVPNVPNHSKKNSHPVGPASLNCFYGKHRQIVSARSSVEAVQNREQEQPPNTRNYKQFFFPRGHHLHSKEHAAVFAESAIVLAAPYKPVTAKKLAIDSEGSF